MAGRKHAATVKGLLDSAGGLVPGTRIQQLKHGGISATKKVGDCFLFVRTLVRGAGLALWVYHKADSLGLRIRCDIYGSGVRDQDRVGCRRVAATTPATTTATRAPRRMPAREPPRRESAGGAPAWFSSAMSSAPSTQLSRIRRRRTYLGRITVILIDRLEALPEGSVPVCTTFPRTIMPGSGTP